MNPNTQSPIYVAPAGNSQPTQPLNAASLASEANDSFNSPQLVQAANNVQTTTQAAQNSQNEDLTLPQMLQQALAPSISNANDPNTKQTQTDLAAELTDLGNPQGIADEAASRVPGAVLSPSQQRSIIAARLGNEGAALSIDNLISGMRMGGLANVIKAAANAHAQQTQKLLNTAQLAQLAYQQLFQQAQAHSDAALKAADLAATLKGLDIQGGQLNLQQSEFQKSTDFNRPIVLQQMQQDAQKGMTWGDMLKKYGNNPYIDTQEILNTYNQTNYYRRPAQVTPQQKNSFNLNLGTGTVPQGITSLFGGGFTSGNSATQNDPLGIR